MPPVYNRKAVDCPAPQVAATYLDPSAVAASPLVLPAMYGPELPDRFNAVAAWIEALGRGGAGVYGIRFGFGITCPDASFTATFGAGQMLLDVPITLPAGASGAVSSEAVNDNTDNFLWWSRSKTPGKRTTADGVSKLLPPDNTMPWGYVGLVTKLGGVTTLDLSGVVYVYGGICYRRTGDAGAPGDTPPANLVLLTLTQRGLYLWDGTAHRALITPGGAGDPDVKDAKESARVVTAAALPAYTRVGIVLTANANGALPNVDGVSLALGDRVLLKDGAAGPDNGIYTVTDLGSGGTPWIATRATDADTSSKVTSGCWARASEGTQAGSRWVLSTLDPINLNTTALSFVLSGQDETEASPAQITATEDDYALAAAVQTFRLTTDAARSVTGFSGGYPGRRVRLLNVGTHNLVVQDQNAGSAAANRVRTGAGDVTLAADQSIELYYDGTSQMWRAF